MQLSRPIHHDFQQYLDFKSANVINMFCDLRSYILEIHHESNELIYHTHALTSVFSISDKLGDAFCMIPIYTNHFNLGFNKGALLIDKHNLLTGTGKLIRHIDIDSPEDYRNPKVHELIVDAIELAKQEISKPSKISGQTISKIKT